jgi:hypothetical protein
LPLTAVSSNPAMDFGFFHVKKKSLWKVEGSSKVSALSPYYKVKLEICVDL